MANDTFHLPVLPSKTSRRSADDTYVRHRHATYQSLLDLAEKTHEYRLTAVQTAMANYLRMPLLWRMGQGAPTLKSFVDQSARFMGDKLFGTGQGHLFSLAIKDDNHAAIEARYGEPVADFHYAHVNPQTGHVDVAIIYRITAGNIEKISNGKSLQLSISELEHLMNVMHRYRLLNRHLSPIDEFIEETGLDFEDMPSHYQKRAA